MTQRPSTAVRAGLAIWSVLALSVASATWAALPPGRSNQPNLVGPEASAVAYASGLRFAWLPPVGAVHHVLVVSTEPFDARRWSRAPQGGTFHVLELAKPIASIEDFAGSLGTASQLYWAAGSAFTRSGPLTFSETRSLKVIPKFANRVAPTPYLKASPIGKATPVAAAEPDRIHLAAGYTIDPKQGEPALPLSMREMSSPPSATRTYLMYYGSDDPSAVRQQILESGGTVVAYLPDHTYLVRMKPEGRVSLTNANAWVGNFQPAYKLSSRLDLSTDAAGTVTVLAFPDGDLAAVETAARAAGGTVLKASDNGINKILRVKLPGAAVPALAQHADVAWIEPYVQPTLLNDLAQWVVQTGINGSRRIWDMGIHGEGQVIHHSDSGIDMTHELFNDASVPVLDFGSYPTHRKVLAYERGSDDPGIEFGDQASASFHGSHTSGTAAGSDVTVPITQYEGMAKGAKLWHSDLSGTALGTSLAPPPDLNDLFQPSYSGNGGGAARLSTNSWGAPVMGAYTIDSYNVDVFMWNHPDYLIFFANGNSQIAGSVGSPATAKDCVSVGGTRNGTLENSLYTSTSRGPTAAPDNRRKPTICAPANALTSAQQGPNSYGALAGTSMATPAATGMAALMRQYCTEGWYPTGTKVPANGFAPSAALLKAMVVNSGVNQVTGTSAPDNNIGFGRVCADSTLLFVGDKRRLLLVDMTSGIGNAQAIEYQVNVVNDSTPLEATLCWTDFPGNPAASIQLVNNLNLTVTNGAVTYKGNVYTTGYSSVGGSYDARNVEEAVNIKAPPPGVWTIRIEGANVPAGPQPFGLCITGGVGTNAGSLALDRASYASTSTVGIEVTDTNAGSSVTVTLASPAEPAGETVTLPGANGVYAGSLPLTPAASTNGDGMLQVSNGDVITATYQDASPSASISQTATVSFYAPIITNVQAAASGTGTSTVTWTTNTNSSSKVYYGATPALGSATPVDPLAVLTHGVTFSGLTSGQTFYFDVESVDLNGNGTRDDNGGQHYRFTARPVGDLLLMYGGPSFDRAARYDAALAELGWFYDTWAGALTDNPSVGNLTAGMRSYDAVWYQPEIDFYPPVTDAARDSIDLYVSGGGRMAILGHDLAWSNSDVTSPFYTPARNAWVQTALHSTYQADPDAWNALYGIAADPISGAYTAGVSYSQPRAGASGDEITAAADASVAWNSGDPTGSAPAGIRWESSSPVGTPGNATWGGAKSRLAVMFFEWTSIDPSADPTSATRRDILHKTLTWLLGRDKPNVTVTAPNGGESITTSSTNITWTETTDGANVASRTLEYSLDGGVSWSTITTSAGPSPYAWNLSSVPNTSNGRVRVRITDDGSPAFSGYDVSNAAFTLARSGGDLIGPAVVAGSFQADPNPILNTTTTALSATISDVLQGSSNVAAAEWSAGPSPAAPGTGQAMTGTFTSQTVAVNATIPVGAFTTGDIKLWARGRDAAGNWGNAQQLSVKVNGDPSVAAGSYVPRDVEFRQNAPNPVTHTTTLVFGLPAASSVRLSIFDITGRKMRTLVNERMSAGLHSVRWDRSDDRGHLVQPGVYYSRMDVNGKVLQRKIVTLE